MLKGSWREWSLRAGLLPGKEAGWWTFVRAGTTVWCIKSAWNRETGLLQWVSLHHDVPIWEYESQGWTLWLFGILNLQFPKTLSHINAYSREAFLSCMALMDGVKQGWQQAWDLGRKKAWKALKCWLPQQHFAAMERAISASFYRRECFRLLSQYPLKVK